MSNYFIATIVQEMTTKWQLVAIEILFLISAYKLQISNTFEVLL